MRYRGLDNTGDFRLLEFLQQSGSQSSSEGNADILHDELQLRLDHYNLERERSNENGEQRELRYIAISYMWGDKEDLDQITVDGMEVVVRSNLKKAVKALQASQLLRPKSKIWLDALCIDQGNQAEVTSEVGRMGGLYEHAEHVFVWLGDALDNSDMAFDFINNVNRAWTDDKAAARNHIKEAFASGPLIWTALSNLLSRPYWSRLWIMQELAMGGGRTIIQCGDRQTTWEKLYRVYESFCENLPKYQTPGLESIFRQERPLTIEGYSDSAYVKCIQFQVIMDGLKHNPRRDQRCLLARCRLGKCLKPADKVYGMLGLLDPAISGAIIPNYDSPLGLVYASFAKAWIMAERDLELLIHGGDIGDEGKRKELEALDMPSWAPDLRMQEMVSTDINHPKYKTGAGIESRFRFLSNDTILSAQGVVLGPLDGLSGWENRKVEDDGYQKMVGAKHNVNFYGSDEAFRDALWRALLGERTRSGSRADESYRCILDIAIYDDPSGPSEHQAHRYLHGRYHTWLQQNASFILGGKPLKQHFLSLNAISESPQLYYSRMHRVCGWMLWRRLAITRNGLIAIVPKGAQVGDVVAVMFGCSLPILLRPMGGTFRIITECYVQGIMDGEIARWLQEEKGGPLGIRSQEILIS